jgi:hypothetical protein
METALSKGTISFSSLIDEASEPREQCLQSLFGLAERKATPKLRPLDVEIAMHYLELQNLLRNHEPIIPARFEIFTGASSNPTCRNVTHFDLKSCPLKRADELPWKNARDILVARRTAPTAMPQSPHSPPFTDESSPS